MIETILEFCVDLDEGCQKTPLRALFTTDNNLAHTFLVRLKRGRNPVTLTNEKVTGFFIRYRDNATVMIEGSIVEGKASVTLTSACYALRGMFSLAIVVGEGGPENTVFLGEGSVSLARTDTLVDEENIIPSLADLLAQIDRMKEATTDANAAAQRADTAANNANAKAQQAQTAATGANNAAQRADTAASGANSAASAAQATANAAAATANQAAERAGNAAEYIEETTVSARKLAPGSTPTAQASTVDGHLHIEYGLVTGDRGAKGDIGPGYTIKGPAYATVAALASAVTSPAEGDQYNVGSAPPYHIYRWTGSAWEDQGALQGPKGDKGDPGSPGAPGATGPAGIGIPKGGTTGQVLVKKSNTDYDTAWKTIESGSLYTQVIITLANSNGASAAGRTVTITNVEDGSVIESVTYSGQPHTARVPVAARYRVEASAAQGYVTPEPVEYTAVADTPRAITLTYQYGLRYGFRREKANSSPDGRITYLYDAVGMTPMAVNLSTGVPNYGSWQNFIDQVCRPVMLKYDGTVDYELDHNDQTKRADNGEASDVANTGYAGNAMVEFGSAFKWVKRYEDANYEYVIFCNIQFDDSYHAYAHTNAKGEIKDAFYWGMFKGTYSNGKLRSIGTGSVMVEQTRAVEISRAQANGSGTDQATNGYYTIYKSGWDYIADLLTLLSKSDNSQAAFGDGRSASSNSAGIGVGSLTAKPAFCGYSNGTSDVKVFYIEGFWGNFWESMAGFILDGTNGVKTKMTPPYNTTGSGYHETGIVPSSTSSGFVDTHSCADASGYVPNAANGSETTYMCDGLWFNTSQVDYALVGGRWSHAGRCGTRSVYLTDLASITNASFGSRLSYMPV